MTRQNKYYKRSRISEAKFRQLVRLFAQDLAACDVAALTGLQRKTVNSIFFKIRTRIAQECERQSPLAQGEVEVDESYFGPRRVRGKRGRGAGSKTPVFGLLKGQGKVYTEIVPDCRKATLQAIIRGRVALESVIHSDGWRGYDGLVDVGYAKHLRVEHGNNEFGFGTRHPPKGHPTASKAFGASLNDACKSSTVSRLTRSICTSKNASGASISVTIIST